MTRSRRLAAVAGPRELVASRPGRSPTSREVILVRHGRLVASVVCDAAEVDAVAARLRRTTLVPRVHPTGVCSGDAEEIGLVATWLEGPRALMHHCDGEFSCTLAGGRVLADEAVRLAASRRSTGRAHSELAAKRTRR